MIYVVTIFFSFQLLVAILLWVGKQKTNQINYLSKYQNTTVIISIKNERQRILPLLKSINTAAIKNKHTSLFKHLDFILVDDHSTDNTYQVVMEQLDVKFRLFRLRDTSGKKSAIKWGVKQSKFDRILTLDADVKFDEYYFNHICKTPCNGLTILPVKMEGKNILQKLYSIEFDFLQHLTFGSAGLKHPVLCNGANLLFTKDAFNQSLKIRTDFKVESGDDVFLLKAIKQKQIPVLAFNLKELLVTTQSPKTLIELLNQRKRWFKKMKGAESFLGALFIFTSNIAFIASLVAVFTNVLFIIPIVIKMVSEIISLEGKDKKLNLMLHQIYYPIYLLLLLAVFPLKTKWK